MERETTYGSWATEAASADALDAALDRASLWRVHSEVPGRLLQPRPCQIDRTVRIDRVLVPNERAIELGWAHGIVGVEVKRSGTKVGPVIAQASDYSRAAFMLPGGFRVLLEYVFIWPMQNPTGSLESVMVQQRLGWAYSWNGRVELTCGRNLTAALRRGEPYDVQATGTRVGSR